MSLSLVEQGGSGAGIGGGKVAEMVASSSTDYLYPAPIAQYEDVISSPQIFMDAIGKFHAAMGTKFKIPIVGGRDLDLHRLFMEVTSRGGFKKVVEEKKWKEVTNCFTFPPSATNASFIIRKYYMTLIHHFEQVYYLKAKTFTPAPTDNWQSPNATLPSKSEMNKSVLLSPEIQGDSVKRQKTITEAGLKTVESSIGLPVTGIIDGKFESGYLCTIKIGAEQLQGVLYQTVQTAVYNIPKQVGVVTMDGTQGSTVVKRRRRRKKSEMKKRDPAHPKPNRSGYNFFFAEQRARLKLLHTGKDRGISRMIGEEWNKLTESEKAVYQEKAVKDKARYKSEMEHYREGLKKEQALTNTNPLQQQYFTMDTNMENNVGISHQIHENEPNSEYYDDDNSSSFEGEEKTTGKDSNLEIGAEIVNTETVAGGKDVFFGEQKEPFNIDESGQQKSISAQENEPLIIENESACIQETESKEDGKSPDVEPMIPDINDENKTKSADNQAPDFGNFDGIDETRPLVTCEEGDLENPR